MSWHVGVRADFSDQAALAGPLPAAAQDPMCAEIRRFAQRSLQSSAAVFYWVENGLASRDAAVSGLPSSLWGEYISDMVQLDPLSVQAMLDAGANMARLPGREESATATYRSFLDRHRVQDVVDMLFYADGIVIAGLGVIKLEGDVPLSRGALDLADAMRPFIETSLQRHERVRRTLRHRRLTAVFHLTSREVEVAELVTDGCSNDEVADRLAIRLPTVKSHLLSIFSKTGSANRTELARLLHA